MLNINTIFTLTINLIIYLSLITYLGSKKMKALITGGAGYIGSTVSNYLIDRGGIKLLLLTICPLVQQIIFQKMQIFLKSIFQIQKRLTRFCLKINTT